jgi:hypothetical protein
MKKKYIRFLFFLLAFAGFLGNCAIKDPLGAFLDGKNNPDTSGFTGITYSFDGGNVSGWYAEPLNPSGHDNAFSVFLLTNASAPAMGTYSLSVRTTLIDSSGAGAYQNGTLWVDLQTPVDLTNKKWFISFYFPKKFGNGWDGYKFCFKDSSASWTWGQCAYQSFGGTSPATNVWITMSNDYSMIAWGSSPGFNAHSVKHLGFQMCGGTGNGLKYDGIIYFDNYRVK